MLYSSRKWKSTADLLWLGGAHTKGDELTFVEPVVAVDRAQGRVTLKRVACAHDCGLIMNPDALRNQVEGNILQALSRSLYEEVSFDGTRVTN
jgi:CO/xanthine dehydrogenase Mo-binding subunit